ncbi:uncharacterized protein LOC134178894 [Corticium candelabrum]|uniref:uncharacterized protein LOC134178894 n=1 Tax=Corticium candelabrum TaxID=121492 RepID=UPI002E25C83C|nr:uncharacterized protein LOC134178894 [Corticium candelabrum]
MNSVKEECTPLKREYDACFNRWYSNKYLKGDYHSDDCATLFAKYQECVMSALKEKNLNIAELQANVLGTDREQRSPEDAKS